MKVLKRGRLVRLPDGTIAAVGWKFDAEGRAVDLDDLTNALQVLIDEAAATDGRVYLPPGVYPITKTLLVN